MRLSTLQASPNTRRASRKEVRSAVTQTPGAVVRERTASGAWSRVATQRCIVGSSTPLVRIAEPAAGHPPKPDRDALGKALRGAAGTGSWARIERVSRSTHVLGLSKVWPSPPRPPDPPETLLRRRRDVVVRQKFGRSSPNTRTRYLAFGTLSPGGGRGGRPNF